ncbi:MAG TPA: hypothetical protein VJH03_24255 [Blastocatellia bacterium]|nr:hypothetical protein [Blastocatellia bacterium]
MFGQRENETEEDIRRSIARQRVKTVVLGTLIVIAVSFGATCLFTYSRYGVTPLDGLFGGSKEKVSPVAGKLAYDKGTKFFLGVIKGEGYSQRRGQVYYIDQGGGAIIEVSKSIIEVREPGQK